MIKELRTHYNSSCIDCGIVEHEMVKIGAFVMCFECTRKTFPNGYDVNQKKYKVRLRKYFEKYLQ